LFRGGHELAEYQGEAREPNYETLTIRKPVMSNTQENTVLDRQWREQRAVTNRLGFKFWQWATDAELADVSIPEGIIEISMPNVWGWVVVDKRENDGPVLTDVVTMTFRVKAITWGEAVAQLETKVAERLAKENAKPRAYFIEKVEKNKKRNALRVIWGT